MTDKFGHIPYDPEKHVMITKKNLQGYIGINFERLKEIDKQIETERKIGLAKIQKLEDDFHLYTEDEFEKEKKLLLKSLQTIVKDLEASKSVSYSLHGIKNMIKNKKSQGGKTLNEIIRRLMTGKSGITSKTSIDETGFVTPSQGIREVRKILKPYRLTLASITRHGFNRDFEPVSWYEYYIVGMQKFVRI